jgi:alginate O-acetyltransferase complex protein AlgI
MLIANYVALPADQIFRLSPELLTPATAWLGAVCYTLQIYFDFSGYSDMAVGMACWFGFDFPQNFKYPYSATSITDFWRRWHISLSTWFRDYLYIPLGGNRGSRTRTCVNLLIVFILCGFWHGASWTFVVWGLFHGAFLILERQFLSPQPTGRLQLWRHFYVLAVVMVGWVFFRSSSLAHALAYLGAMAGQNNADPTLHPAALYLDAHVILILVVGTLASFPLLRFVQGREDAPQSSTVTGWHALRVVGLAACLMLSLLEIVSGSYNPFIYYHF